MSRIKPKRIIEGKIYWQCSKCKCWASSDGFYNDVSKPIGITSTCKTCHTKVSLATRDKENTLRINREYMRRARGKDPEKFRLRDREFARRQKKDIKYWARSKLNHAIRRGELARPKTCERCNRAIKVTGHHYDYSKPLDINWLCYECHGIVDRDSQGASGCSRMFSRGLRNEPKIHTNSR